MKDAIGIIVVHLLEKNKDKLSYFSGSVQEGLNKVNFLLKLASKNDIPVFLSEGKDKSDKTIKSIFEGVSTSNFHFVSEFKFIYLDDLFKKIIKQKKITNFVVLGFNREECVIEVIEDLSNSGYVFFTTDEILFGNKSFFTSEKALERNRALSLNKIQSLKNANLFSTLDELIKEVFV